MQISIMSTRQLRLMNRDQIQKRLKEFAGRKINIVFENATVLLATLVQAGDSHIDVLNMRSKKITIPLQTISEIYIDTKE
jgi:hypothetical protein